MNIHEYQAKLLLSRYGVPVPRGAVAYTPKEAEQAAKSLGGPVFVVKAQIHAGGRGKAGGVKIVRSVAEARAAAASLLGRKLVTHQTGPMGREVKRVYVEEGRNIAQELYLSLLIDRATSRVTILASAAGGMDIEEVAAKSPEKLVKVAIDPAIGAEPFYARKVAYALGLEGDVATKAAALIGNLYKAFVAFDASLIEINPLVVTAEGDVIALDSKMTFDENALFRHKEIEELRDADEEDPAEAEAARNGLNYIRLDGNIGCMVNGAGLAMATMDTIKMAGGEPANFLDVGGGATRERVSTAFKLIVGDPKVEGIMVNIFGGIMRCDVIAEGIVAAVREVNLVVPLVVRLEGTNVDLGKEILERSGLKILPASSLEDAAKKIVKAVKAAA
ncbi:MAG: ADP-forming succinate--CoA ligase subunit beta [Alphaproteobacteria bacterium]